jgi:cell division protein FtsL
LYGNGTIKFVSWALAVAIVMKQNTIISLLQAYTQLQQIAAELYTAAEAALENDDFDDASLLASRADKIYEEAENVDILISELEGE